MKRKLGCLFLALVLLLGLTTLAFAEGEQLPYVIDAAGLLTQEEAASLESMAQEVSQKYGCGVYVVTVDDYTDYDSRGVNDAAYTIYHQYSLGEGADRNGAMLLLSMRDRDWATFFYGPAAEYAFDAYGQEKLEESYLDYFHENDWYGGFSGYINECGNYLYLAAQGTPVRASKLVPILIVVAIACLIAIIVCGILRGMMKSVSKKTEAGNYVSAAGLKLTQSTDQYTHTTTLERHIDRGSSSGSGSGSSSYSGGGGSGRSGKF